MGCSAQLGFRGSGVGVAGRAANGRDGTEAGGPSPRVLTPRELEVARLTCESHSAVAIGERLYISHRTVETHKVSLYRKLGIHDVAALVRWAMRHGVLEV